MDDRIEQITRLVCSSFITADNKLVLVLSRHDRLDENHWKWYGENILKAIGFQWDKQNNMYRVLKDFDLD